MALSNEDIVKIVLIIIVVNFIYNKFVSKREGYSRRFGALSGSNNMVLTDDKGNLSSIQFPKGMIMLWQGSSAPEGWALCDGGNGTPDLRGKFVLGFNPSSNNPKYRTIGGSDGEEKVTFTISPEQMPAHSHGVLGIGDSCGSCNKGGPTGFNLGDRGVGYFNTNRDNQQYVSNTGSGQPITLNNMPPFYTLAYIMKL